MKLRQHIPRLWHNFGLNHLALGGFSCMNDPLPGDFHDFSIPVFFKKSYCNCIYWPRTPEQMTLLWRVICELRPPLMCENCIQVFRTVKSSLYSLLWVHWGCLLDCPQVEGSVTVRCVQIMEFQGRKCATLYTERGECVSPWEVITGRTFLFPCVISKSHELLPEIHITKYDISSN